MFDHLSHALSAEGFMPHGMCYLWQPGILTLHVVSDAFITLAYATIPFTLLYFARKRRDLQFNWMTVCFAVFIIACGTTHLMEIVTIWNPVYWLSGTIKAITALASVPTAFLLVKLVPDALRWPSPAALRREIEVRERAEYEVRKINEQLEARVIERTAQLEAANQQLRSEMRFRQQAEETMRTSRLLLEAVVDNSEAVIYAKDPEGRYLLTNRSFEVLLSLKRGEILGMTDERIFPLETAASLRANDLLALEADSAITREEIVPLADGPHTYLSVKAPLRDESGKVYAMFGVSTDITERTAADERQRGQLEHLTLLDRTTREIAEQQEVPGIYQVVLRGVEEALQIDLAVVCTRETDGPTLTVTSVGPGSLSLANQLALFDQVKISFNEDSLARFLDGELVYEPDLATSTLPFPERLTRAGLRSLVIAPLIVERKVRGALICARRSPHGFSGSEREFLTQLTQHMSLAAQRARRYDTLQRAYESLRSSLNRPG